MLIIQSYPVAILLCFITMLCWGSWGNTQKLASREWKYQLFYWDYGLGVLLSALAIAFTIGSAGEGGRGFIADISQAGWQHMALAFLGGVLFNLANILLVIAIDIAGLAVAFPIGIGLALVLGTLQTYYFRPDGNPALLFTGVALIALAIIFNATAYKKLISAKAGSGAPASSTLGIVISVLAGLLMGCGFFGLVTKGMVHNFARPEAGLMTPYTALVVFALGLFISNFVWNTIASKKPVRGEPVALADYFAKGNLRLHAVGILGGAIWCFGMAFSLIASSAAGAALSYALGQGATMVSALWGVFIWKEFKDAPKVADKFLAFMFASFVIGLGFLVASKL